MLDLRIVMVLEGMFWVEVEGWVFVFKIGGTGDLFFFIFFNFYLEMVLLMLDNLQLAVVF